MIDLNKFKQGIGLSRNKIDDIDMGTAKEWSKKSYNEQKEYAGNWTVRIVNDQLQVEIEKIYGGGIADVEIPPTGWTWHTHPRGCSNLNDCSIIPPSATDMKLFAERYDDQHMVMTQRRIYWVKANRKYTEDEIEKIHDFYLKLEKHFDDGEYTHDKFDDIFTLASKFGNFFKIYKFRNEKILTLDS